eukprot:Clim_evm54s207 gene=Clim_evmTU54s207
MYVEGEASDSFNMTRDSGTDVEQHGKQAQVAHDKLKEVLKNEPELSAISATIPTSIGPFDLHIYDSQYDGKEHLAFVVGDPKNAEKLPVRVHSECFTGDIMGSLRCDCGEQLRTAMDFVAEQGRGIILYLRQEGRGIGLKEKLKAYRLQDQGYDTVEANLMLGHGADERDYRIAADMLKDLGVKSVQLLTNNPRKIEDLQQYGINIADRMPMHPALRSEHNLSYLATKVKRMDHMLNLNILAQQLDELKTDESGPSQATVNGITMRKTMRSDGKQRIRLEDREAGIRIDMRETTGQTEDESSFSERSGDSDSDEKGPVDMKAIAKERQVRRSSGRSLQRAPSPSISTLRKLNRRRVSESTAAARPYVTLTFAQTLDGSIADRGRKQVAISGEESMEMTHRLRARHSAILVGIGTVVADDPRLTVRLVEGPNPQPVVLDTHLRFPLDRRLLKNDIKPIIMCGTMVNKDKVAELENLGAKVVKTPVNTGGQVDLEHVLDNLGKMGYESLMVEGGASIIQAFLSSRLVDQLVVTISPKFLNGFNALGREAAKVELPQLEDPQYTQYGKDMVLSATPKWS